LLCCFQQNTQRSIASWTYHAITVKAAIQLGLHAPAFYNEHGTQKNELLKRVWFAVINQDSLLSTAMGRPCLIPSEHVQIDIPSGVPLNLDCMPSSSRGDHLLYFNRLM
jgi:hypothetical protein